MNEWLPDRDLNPDKQNQNLSCYRYTIGQLSVRNYPIFCHSQADATRIQTNP